MPGEGRLAESTPETSKIFAPPKLNGERGGYQKKKKKKKKLILVGTVIMSVALVRRVSLPE